MDRHSGQLDELDVRGHPGVRRTRSAARRAPAFSYLREIETGNERMVDQNNASWNRLTRWLGQIEALRAGRQ